MTEPPPADRFEVPRSGPARQRAATEVAAGSGLGHDARGTEGTDASDHS
jgi:hypothetical protein